ncbi:MAG: mevalonate kinase, partial [Lentisphaerota bacterium]
IISGEHAVVFGKPALVTAINRNAQAIITPGDADLISFDLPDIQQNGSFTIRALRELTTRVAKNYHMFLNGDLTIREVLLKPIDLFEFAFITVLDGLHLKVANGLNIQMHSNIPIGCGMGSSAASILSVLRAVGHYFRVDFRPDWYYKYSLEAENLQHGHASGVDSYISLHGGCVRFQNGQAVKLPLPRISMYIVNTGVPETSTGECVVQVGRNFGKSNIWDHFEAVTREMEKALMANDLKSVQRCIHENSRLLTEIGVVPQRVQQFISDVEQWGGAAKVCGAGAVAGDKAGVVLVAAETPPVELCTKYGYEIMTVRGEPLGARIVELLLLTWLKASAPGNLMLLGEHAVLHGHSALVCAVNRRMHVALKPRMDRLVLIDSTLGQYQSDLDTLFHNATFKFVLSAVAKFRSFLPSGFNLRIESEFSHQVGLGSSAAVTAATVAVLSAWAQKPTAPDAIFQRSRNIVRDSQGVGSGADVAASVFGGIVLYRAEPLEIKKLNALHLLTVLYSGSKRPTAEVIRLVETAREKNPALFDGLFQKMGQSAEQAAGCIQGNEWKHFGALLNANQELMEAIGVSNDTLSGMARELQKDPGILGAKISGSGLGDCVVGLGHARRTDWPWAVVPAEMSLEGLTLS